MFLQGQCDTSSQWYAICINGSLLIFRDRSISPCSEACLVGIDGGDENARSSVPATGTQRHNLVAATRPHEFETYYDNQSRARQQMMIGDNLVIPEQSRFAAISLGSALV